MGRLEFYLEVGLMLQTAVNSWMTACFGCNYSNQLERSHRFLEEAIEVAQACGCPKEDCLKLVENIYNKPIGDVPQEVGGALLTLCALCTAFDLSLEKCGTDELSRIWKNIDLIRDKQKAKRELMNRS